MRVNPVVDVFAFLTGPVYSAASREVLSFLLSLKGARKNCDALPR
jgi:hypothetical protein